jgi:hypothetical protein
MIRGFVLAALSLAAFGQAARATVLISSKPTQNMSCSAGVCSPTARNATLNVGDLTSMLAGGDVSIQSGSLAKDIEIRTAFSWTSNQRLTLDSYRSIFFQKVVTVAGPGALTIVTDDGGTGGDFRFEGKGRVEFWDTTSNLMINGAHFFLARTMRQLVVMIRHGSGNYALARNIDVGKKTYEGSPFPESFTGNFEGLGNTISNLKLKGSLREENVGFFEEYSSEDPSKAIRDLHLVSVSIVANNLEQHVGGVVGYMVSGNIVNVDVSGNISASGQDSVAGGMVGLSFVSKVRNSSAQVNVTLGSDVIAGGGLIGQLEDGCPDCTVALDSDYALGTVSGGDGIVLGGLIGENLSAKVTNCFARGAVSGGSNASAGGLIGINGILESGTQPVLETSYSTGAVSGGGGSMAGGVLGQDQSSPSASDTYWDLDTSGIADPTKGAGNIANDPGLTGLSTSQFMSALPAGFDTQIWGRSPGVNGGYPYLLALPPG